MLLDDGKPKGNTAKIPGLEEMELKAYCEYWSKMTPKQRLLAVAKEKK